MEPRGQVVHVGQGEMAVSDRADTLLTTILGSCVAACIWDPARGLGGMNHILLPDGPESDLRRELFGTNAMELLINRLLHDGAERNRLQGKLFGGARMIEGLSDVGERNSQFALSFCRREKITVAATSLGGTGARRVQFWPQNGKARQRVLTDTWVREDRPRIDQLQNSEVELF